MQSYRTATDEAADADKKDAEILARLTKIEAVLAGLGGSKLIAGSSRSLSRC